MPKDKFISKNILEVRLKNKFLPFLDKKGEALDFLLKKYNYNRFRYIPNEGRVEVVSNNLDKVLFFSVSNFGFQVEGVEDLDIFKREVSSFFSTLKDFKIYQPTDFLRIGTKTIIYSHLKGKNFDEMKRIYKDLFFKDLKKIEQKTKTVFEDFGFIVEDVSKGNGMANIQTGPIKKDQVLEVFLGENEKYKNFIADAGYLLSIDYYKKDIDTDIQKLENDVLDNIKNIEEIFNGFEKSLKEDGE